MNITHYVMVTYTMLIFASIVENCVQIVYNLCKLIVVLRLSTGPLFCTRCLI